MTYQEHFYSEPVLFKSIIPIAVTTKGITEYSLVEGIFISIIGDVVYLKGATGEFSIRLRDFRTCNKYKD